MIQTSSSRLLSALLLILLLVPSALPGPLDAAQDRKGKRSAKPDRELSGGESKSLQGRGSEFPSARGAGRDGTDRRTSGTQTLPDGVPSPDPAQQKNIENLRESLVGLADGASAAEDEIRGLAQDLQGMGLQAPDPALTQALAEDLAAAMADASLTPREMAELTQSIYAVLDSAGLNQQEIQVLKDDVEAVLTASGVDRSDVQAILDDLQAIADASQGAASGRQDDSRGRPFRRGPS